MVLAHIYLRLLNLLLYGVPSYKSHVAPIPNTLYRGTGPHVRRRVRDQGDRTLRLLHPATPRLGRQLAVLGGVVVHQFGEACERAFFTLCFCTV